MARKTWLIISSLFLVLVACGESEQATGDAVIPDVLRSGRTLYADTCSVCHGPRGQGGVGPSLESVVVTWPDCNDQVAWISLGSEGWANTHGDTYGSNANPIKGGMPPQGDQMSDEEIRLVAAFERVEYGGQDREAALLDCGIE